EAEACPPEQTAPPLIPAAEGERRPKRPRVRRRKKRPEAGRGRALWVLAVGAALLVGAVLVLVLALIRRAGEQSRGASGGQPLTHRRGRGGRRRRSRASPRGRPPWALGTAGAETKAEARCPPDAATSRCKARAQSLEIQAFSSVSGSKISQ